MAAVQVRIEIEEVPGGHGGWLDGCQRVQPEFQACGRAGQLLMIKLPNDLATTIEIW